MAQTLKQQKAELEAKLARVNEKTRQEENGQKIIVGGMVLNAAKTNAKLRKWLIDEAEKSLKREADKKRMAPILKELKDLEMSSDALNADAVPAKKPL